MTMRDQCIEAMARAMLKPWAHRDFNEQELAGARKDAIICLDTLLDKLKSPTEEMLEAGRDQTDFALEAWQAMLSTLSQEGK